MTATKSQKIRKKLERVVLKKKAKVDRANLLAELKKCQLQPSQLELLHSTSSMQTRGLKRFLKDESFEHLKSSRLDEIDEAELRLSKTKRRRKSKKREQQIDSSSEDTDAISTDTEIYYSSSTSPEPSKLVKLNATQDPSVNVEIARAPNVERLTPDTHKHVKAQNVPGNARCDDTVLADSSETKSSSKASQPAIYVQVSRISEIEKSRLELPIIGEEQNIMEKIRYNDIVIISGETGSGKTTQIPQFLYEAGYALDGMIIGITEPRRVAAVSMSERVAKELNLSQREVSYQVRFSGNVTSDTQIKFMTDGVLLRECQQDFLLSKYSVIIIDEAHERSVFSDILIGLLSRIVPMRAKRNTPLKLVIMSATLRVGDFTENSLLFKQQPPLINIEARQFPVTVQFSKKTPSNHLQAAYRKICSIHSKMPLRGGILVFVTSQMDVKILCRKLKEKFPQAGRQEQQTSKRIKRIHSDAKTAGNSNEHSKLALDNLKENAEFGSEEEDDEPEVLTGFRKLDDDLLEWSEIESEDEDEGRVPSSKSPLFCLGLFAMLPLEKQRLVFKNPPEGTRLCVIATNVAETSITIPNIKYVVDTGLEKTKVYDTTTGISRFVTAWTSKSSAEQRTGRAGRVGPGHCYRLYTSAVYTNDFPEYAQPRILQKPVEDVLLQMKSMSIDNVVNFPFPTRPSIDSLKAAEKKLILLGALDDSKIKKARFEDIAKTEYSSRLTPLGKAMARFPVSARCSKMIVLSPPGLLPHVIALVSALTVREMFLEGNQWRPLKKQWASQGDRKLLGDFLVMLRAICTADSFECSNRLCLENGLRTKAMLEIDKLRKQLTHEINGNLNCPSISTEPNLKKPNDSQIKILRQLLLSSYCDHVAKKLPDGNIVEKKSGDSGKPERKKLKHAYECMETDVPVYISPESTLKGEHPEYLIYKEIFQGGKKMYMRDVAVIDPEWLPFYANKLCNFSDNSEKAPNPPKYDKELDQIICYRPTTYGPLNWQLGSIQVPMNLLETGADIFKHFACFLLSGEIIDWFKKYADKLLAPPSIVTKPWSKLQPRTSKILQALVDYNVRSKRDLMKVWKKDISCKYLIQIWI